MKQSPSDSSTAPNARRQNSVPVKGPSLEIVAGMMSLVMAMIADALRVYDITVWRMVISGCAGLFGAYAFLHTVGFSLDRTKAIAVLLGAAMASFFAPPLANYIGYKFIFLPLSYFSDSICGFLVGLISTPILGFVRNPGPVAIFVAGFIPFLRKKD